MSDHIPMRVAVVGATGHQGGAAARLLAGRGHLVRTLSRRPGADRPALPGVLVIDGDLGRQEDVHRLFDGATHAVVTMPLVYEAEKVMRYAQHLAKAARESRLRRIVYNANTRMPSGTTRLAAFETRRLAETVLREGLADGGAELVVLRPPVYLDNLFSPWNGPALVDDGVLAYPLPEDSPVAWLSLSDLAGAVAAALTAEGVGGRSFDIGGARSLTGAELAEAFGRGLGRTVEYRPLRPEVFERTLARILGPASAHGVAGVYHFMAGRTEPLLMADDGGEWTKALDTAPAPVEEWVARQPWRTWSERPAQTAEPA
ncbi:SDR family oxidoreductase [Streptomyces sanyensis]|uniref:SDR family oxidoreductase n=1 Tax=Streptomyces sanyensis TaxID=568869 RepID=UPI003D77BF8C